MSCPERSNFYENFAKICYIVSIKSVVKGRHKSKEKDHEDIEELLEVAHERDNKVDPKAFRVNPLFPSSATYGHVPSNLSHGFYNMIQLSDEIGLAYEIWWYVAFLYKMIYL